MTGDTQAMWALAAGCVPDAMPWDIPRIAQKAGFLSSGMWVEPATTWSSNALSKTRLSLAETGISLVDVEVIWLEGGRPGERRAQTDRRRWVGTWRTQCTGCFSS